MAPMKTNERAAVRVAQKLVSEIRRLRMRPGTKLASEHTMVEKLGVARATVREALRFLEGYAGSRAAAAQWLERVRAGVGRGLSLRILWWRLIGEVRPVRGNRS